MYLVLPTIYFIVSLGVFENNESAYYCYKAIGFEDVSQDEIEKYTVMGEEWNCSAEIGYSPKTPAVHL